MTLDAVVTSLVYFKSSSPVETLSCIAIPRQ